MPGLGVVAATKADVDKGLVVESCAIAQSGENRDSSHLSGAS